MKDLAEFILENITEAKSFTVDEIEENGHVQVEVKAKPEIMGLIIGKGGGTIKAIQTLLRIKGRLSNKLVNLSISELTG